MKKRINIYILIVCGVFLYAAYSFICDINLKTLSPPQLITGLNSKYRYNVPISGTAHPKANVLVFSNSKQIDSIPVDDKGVFAKTIIFNKSGVQKIKIKQNFKKTYGGTVSSSFSKEYQVEIVNSPPDKNLFRLDEEFPALTNNQNLVLTGEAVPNGYLIANGKRFVVKSNGIFKLESKLSEGANNFYFSMSDNLNNQTSVIQHNVIFLDTMSPSISQSEVGGYLAEYDMKKNPTKELVFVDIGTWRGSGDIISVPITGKIYGDIKKLTIDGKDISWDENNEIFQRIPLRIEFGLNKYKVVVEDKVGNVSSGYIETTSTTANEQLDVNLNQ